ncbi:MAG: multifunctional oxoglutarate decarboxylase/oxoglutarate dehydrogenase thiamine pyrophosphate-binding subunit/dihydrolipoyllysine-residue succinyltransferase subunit [Actinomycetota bacterium]
MALSDESLLGPNSWLVDEMYEQWRENPSSVSSEWQQLFANGGAPPIETELAAPANGDAPSSNGAPAAAPTPAAPPEPAAAAPAPSPAATSTPPPAPAAATPEPAPAPAAEEEDPTEPLRGAAARIVANMEASLGVPTATSYRQVPSRLLEVNRAVINGYLGRIRGGKVSFTHLIGYAVIRAMDEVPGMRQTYVEGPDGKPRVHRHEHVGLGIAVDVEKSDGSRSLLVPAIKSAGAMDFKEYWESYEALISKVRSNSLSVDDFSGATHSLTNVGTIGTLQSVPRLMPGQAAIIGVGAIDFPAEFRGSDPVKLAEFGISKVITISNTYDHRVIQGAESGLFLKRVEELLLGQDGFYDSLFAALGVPYEPVRWRRDVNPIDREGTLLQKQMQVRKIIQMYRVRGHLIADLDPLRMRPPSLHAELDPATYGLTIWDNDREFLTDDLPGPDRMKFGDILHLLRDAYCRTSGIEYMHISDPREKEWIQQRVEGPQPDFTSDEVVHIMQRLNAADAFEKFLHKRYVGHKRFGVDGGEAVIPLVDAILQKAADDPSVTASVIGMAHRGRLNVLSNIMGKSLGRMFLQFEGGVDPSTVQGSGDVKYHLGERSTFTSRSGAELDVELAANPSHLEAVDPVVIGMARAIEDITEPQGSFPVLPVLLHGDAAFAGQGVVAESLNLSKIPGYRVGGTVHVVINNQVGYTTPPSQARSSEYATDVAKMVQAPIFHVNGNDPEACVRVARLAYDYRQAFHKDVVIDMLCYRRHGHNEGDDPSYTQPLMYQRIDEMRSVRELYVEALIDRGDLTPDRVAEFEADYEHRLQDALDDTRATAPDSPPQAAAPQIPPPPPFTDTGVDQAVLDRIVGQLNDLPEGFTLHPKLAKQFETRTRMYESGEADFGLGETFAYGSLLLEGTPVRIAGQDSRRGTFAHRHSVYRDYHTEDEYTPLSSLSDDQATFWIYDSMLSEYAALGFEFGYSTKRPETLVIWEAQFGDFVNGAQIIIDQFIAASEDKWGQRSGLVMLLPHGYEGQGPEHSSARVERFLILCAENNMCIANATTSAQFFHLLRRQMVGGLERPLVVFTPKSLLRAKQARSPLSDFTSGGFREVIDDPGVTDRDAVRSVALCTGKIAYEAMERRDRIGAPTAIVRVEQMYPFPEDEIRRIVESYPNVEDLVWLQEEPQNMGAFSFIGSRLYLMFQDEGLTLRLASRAESGSPACGSAVVHAQEAEQLMEELFRQPLS